MVDNKNNIILTDRLLCVSEYIRDGAVLCDVGTDHAKLPIYLVMSGRIKMAYATDINEGPIRSARNNIAKLGLSDKVKCIKTDGLKNTDGLFITDITICGMGGELIARILSECSYLKDPELQIVVQPMSHTEDIRRFLWDEGFSVDRDIRVKDSGKLYTVICTHYTGERYNYSELDLLLGACVPNDKRDELYYEMVDRVLYHLKNKQMSKDQKEREKAALLYKQVMEVLG